MRVPVWVCAVSDQLLTYIGPGTGHDDSLGPEYRYDRNHGINHGIRSDSIVYQHRYRYRYHGKAELL